MRFYECTVILRSDLSKNQVDEVQAELVKILTDLEGSTSRHEYWGLRNLAYQIQKANRAHYIFFNITAPSAAVQELERKMRINEQILRYLTVKTDELDNEPSAMMQTKFRDEQRETRRDYGHRDNDRNERSDRNEERAVAE